MKVGNSIVSKQGGEKKTFSAAVTGPAIQNMIAKSVSTPEAAARLTGNLISAVAASAKLQQCKPATIVAAALRGEGAGLTMGRDYYLVPFGDSCNFLLGYKGLLTLLISGGKVADTNCFEVREGEFKGRDRRTKRPIFDFSTYTTDEEAAAHPIVGYYFYVEMKDGYFRAEYMSVPEIIAHATRYSKSFDPEKYRLLESGDLSTKEADALKEKSPWYGSFDTMAKKTVIRRLLNSGYVPIANSTNAERAIEADRATEQGYVDVSDFSVSHETGEVKEEPGAIEEVTTETPVEVVLPEKKKQNQKVEVPEYPQEDDDFQQSFFDN